MVMWSSMGKSAMARLGPIVDEGFHYKALAPDLDPGILGQSILTSRPCSYRDSIHTELVVVSSSK